MTSLEQLDLENSRLIGVISTPSKPFEHYGHPKDEPADALCAVPTQDGEEVYCLAKHHETFGAEFKPRPDQIEGIAETHLVEDHEVLELQILDPKTPLGAITALAVETAKDFAHDPGNIQVEIKKAPKTIEWSDNFLSRIVHKAVPTSSFPQAA